MFKDLNLEKILKNKKEEGYQVNIIVERSTSMVLWEKDISTLNSEEFNLFYLKDFSLFKDETLESGIPLTDLSSKEKTINLLITDCVSEYWGTTKAYSFMEEVGKNSFFSILNVLPQRMWKRTILDNTWRIKFTHKIDSGLVSDIDEVECGVTEHLKVPMMTVDNISMKHWNNLVAGEKDCWVYGSLFEKREFSNILNNDKSEIEEDYPPVERIQNFECAVPPMGQKLAIYLSAIPLTLESMKFVQKEILEGKTIDLVEVYLSGLLKRTENGFDFVDGVRDLLADKLYEHKKIEIKKRVYEQ